MPDPTITIAIPTYLRDGMLVATIRQVLAQQPQPDEIIVIDQTPVHDASTLTYLKEGSSAGLFRWIEQREPSVTKARNRALSEATGELVLFIDDDVWLPEKFIAAHLICHRARHVDILNGPIKKSSEDSLVTDEMPNASPGTLAMTVPANFGRPWDGIPRVHGGNHSVRRRAAIAAGGYDEQFTGPSLLEDVDFGFRALARGCSIGYEPAAWLVHLAAPSGGCRIPGRSRWREWEKTMGVFLFGFRHSTNARLSWTAYGILAKMAIRAGPLRRENVFHFWRQPLAWAGVLQSPFVERSHSA
ncbi:MAG: glycosyltransferase [Terracidiphilus sp.]